MWMLMLMLMWCDVMLCDFVNARWKIVMAYRRNLGNRARWMCGGGVGSRLESYPTSSLVSCSYVVCVVLFLVLFAVLTWCIISHSWIFIDHGCSCTPARSMQRHSIDWSTVAVKHVFFLWFLALVSKLVTAPVLALLLQDCRKYVDLVHFQQWVLVVLHNEPSRRDTRISRVTCTRCVNMVLL